MTEALVITQADRDAAERCGHECAMRAFEGGSLGELRAQHFARHRALSAREVDDTMIEQGAIALAELDERDHGHGGWDDHDGDQKEYRRQQARAVLAGAQHPEAAPPLDDARRDG